MTRQFSISEIVALIDLTSLNTDDSNDSIKALCAKAQSSSGPVAGLCIYPQFLPIADAALRQVGKRNEIRLVTVTNFPDASEDIARAELETMRARELGADEIDVVFPWRALAAGNAEIGTDVLKACREAAGDCILKVILESGELRCPALIRQASLIAISAGANFIKTSTGKMSVHATPEAARIMLQSIADSQSNCGFKAAGGVRSLADAETYLNLAAELLGEDWITPEHFRFGASGLLDNLQAGDGNFTPAIY